MKELKALLKESSLNRRGLLSKLKRKQDLVDFLEQNLGSSIAKGGAGEVVVDTETVDDEEGTVERESNSNHNNSDDNDDDTVVSHQNTVPAKPTNSEQSVVEPSRQRRRRRRPGMPPLSTSSFSTEPIGITTTDSPPPTLTTDETPEATDNSTTDIELNTAQLPRPSSGHPVFDKVLRRYPVLQDEYDQRIKTLKNRYKDMMETDEDMDEEDDTKDVRQLHHPMLRNTTDSDLDIVFIGTASCTPGLTRGVSCTALRLNWNRQVKPEPDGTIPKQSTYSGGTWIFDAGECTQVRDIVSK